MFDSGISAADLIAQIKSEADIAIPIEDKSYISWLNALEQLLYTEVIKEQKKYRFGIYSSLLETKFNFWPSLDDQKVNDVVLTRIENGVYRFKTESVVSTVTNKGAEFKTTVALPAGTYAISDNAAPYNMLSGRSRIYAADANGTVLASVDATAAATASKSFTIAEDKVITLCIAVPQGANLSSSGYTVKPQLEAGETKTAFMLPFDSLSVFPYLLCDYPNTEGEAPVRFENIHTVFADGTQLIKSTLTSGVIFSETFFKDENYLGLHLSEKPEEITVVYTVRPELKDESNISGLNVMLPAEFIDLAKAKLRGEAYKAANEMELSAVWLNDYNVLLETFKAWIAGKQPEFGM